MSEGLRRAGFEVTGVDINPQPHYRGGTFVQADALTFPLEGYDFIHAPPPCQAPSVLRALHPGREYPDLIPETRARLVASGIPYSIENVEGAPLGASGFLIMLCGTMFGLQTPDGRAEIRRHRLFETSFGIPLRPACQHGWGGATESLSVVGPKGLPGLSHERRAQKERRESLSVTGTGMGVGGKTRWAERKGRPRRTRSATRSAPPFSVEDARAAMGIDWMPMKYLSQAIPPAYGELIGREALAVLGHPAP
jgi:DNA (cytosine-5)-methyltransferase 1